MAWKLMYLEALDAPRRGEAAREAERRAMYARPDAEPLPEEPVRKGWLSTILGRATAPESTSPEPRTTGLRTDRGRQSAAGGE